MQVVKLGQQVQLWDGEYIVSATVGHETEAIEPTFIELVIGRSVRQ